MSLARVQFFSISLDGFGTGEGQSLETPFGHAGERLHEWMFETQWWHANAGQPGGGGGIDDTFVVRRNSRFGAVDQGARKSAARLAPEPQVEGLVGSQPAITTPVWSSPTARPRSRSKANNVPLRRCLAGRGARDGREAAGDQDVPDRWRCHHDPRSLPRGSSTTCTSIVVPILLGRGERLLRTASKASTPTTDRGHILAEGSDARDVHPRGALNLKPGSGAFVLGRRRGHLTRAPRHRRSRRPGRRSPSWGAEGLTNPAVGQGTPRPPWRQRGRAR